MPATAGPVGLPQSTTERLIPMMLTGLTRRFRGPAARMAADESLIGAADRTFACPGCARPLPIGQGRCSGCGSFLVAGVLVRTAVFLMLIGSVVGLIGGALVAGVAMGPRLAAGDAARAALAAASPPPAEPASTDAAGRGASGVSGSNGATGGTPAVSPAAAGPTLPEGVGAAFVQVATVNDRLARSEAALGEILARRTPASADVAPLLRKLAADARTGAASAARLGTWDGAGDLPSAARALYAAVLASASDGLAAPLADGDAYAQAGRRMLTALDGLPSLAAATRDAAARAGVDLPAATPAP